MSILVRAALPAIFAVVVFLAGEPLAAQPAAATKVVLNNTKLTAVVATYPPGATLQTHGAGRLIYVIAGPYRATWKMANGHTMRVVHQTGDTYWFPGGTILVTNVGRNTVRVLAVIPNQ
ncbi:MAG: hypothetical protein ABSH03_21930 [Candidatus Lustribacter sp.]|jgi:quercetin dioxygenase-like cupin family protein